MYIIQSIIKWKTHTKCVIWYRITYISCLKEICHVLEWLIILEYTIALECYICNVITSDHSFGTFTDKCYLTLAKVYITKVSKQNDMTMVKWKIRNHECDIYNIRIDKIGMLISKGTTLGYQPARVFTLNCYPKSLLLYIIHNSDLSEQDYQCFSG